MDQRFALDITVNGCGTLCRFCWLGLPPSLTAAVLGRHLVGLLEVCFCACLLEGNKEEWTKGRDAGCDDDDIDFQRVPKEVLGQFPYFVISEC